MNIDPGKVNLSDRRKHPFYLIENSLIDEHGPAIGAYGIAVYNVLAYYANQKDAAWPSYQTIADKIGASRPKVIETVKMLIERGIILKEKRKTPAGDSTSNQYILTNLTVVNDINQGSKQDLPPSKQDLPGVVNSIDQGSKPRLPEQDPIEQDPIEQDPNALDEQPPELSQDEKETKALTERLHYVGSPATPHIVDTYMELAKEVTLENVLRGLTAAAEQGKQYSVAYVTTCARNAQRGESSNFRNGAMNGTHRRNGGFGREQTVRNEPEPEFVPDEKFLAQMERFNAIRNGRAPVPGS